MIDEKEEIPLELEIDTSGEALEQTPDEIELIEDEPVKEAVKEKEI